MAILLVYPRTAARYTAFSPRAPAAALDTGVFLPCWHKNGLSTKVYTFESSDVDGNFEWSRDLKSGLDFQDTVKN